MIPDRFSRWQRRWQVRLLIVACLQSGCGKGLTYRVTEKASCKMEVSLSGGNVLNIDYQTLPANQAGYAGNRIWMWRASEIPWRTPPQQVTSLPPSATESGSIALETDGLSLSDYIVAYSVGARTVDICSCSRLGAKGGNPVETMKLSVELESVSRKRIWISYESLNGYLPASSGNWVGIWPGKASPYNPFPPLGSTCIQENSTGGRIMVNGLSLGKSKEYTLIYFLGESLHSAAYMLRFRIEKKQ